MSKLSRNTKKTLILLGSLSIVGAIIFNISVFAVKKTQNNSDQNGKPDEPDPNPPTPPVDPTPPPDVKPEKPEEGKIYETKDGILFNHKGEITKYNGAAGKSIKIENLLIDKDNPNILVVPNKINDNAFKDIRVKSISITWTIQEIGANAFNNSEIENITFEGKSSLKIIGESAFLNHKIQNILIPSSVEQLSSFAFKTNHLINGQTINFNKNENIKTILQETFYGNIFSEIELPINVATIQYKAFSTGNKGTPTSLTVKFTTPFSYLNDNQFEGYIKPIQFIDLRS